MSELSLQDQLNQQKIQAAKAALSPTKYDDIVASTRNKLLGLEEASANKINALQSLEDTIKARESLGGTLAGFGLDSDSAREFSQATIAGTGSTIGGVGQFFDDATMTLINAIPGADKANEFFHSLSPDQGSVGDFLQKGEDALYQTADNINQAQMPSYRHEMDQTTPTGDLLDWSTWSLGEDPSIAGATGQLINMVGQFTPQLLAMVLTRGQSVATQMGTTASVGGAQAGGGASTEVENLLGGMNESELSEASGLYRDLRDQDYTHDQAKKSVIDTAASAAFAGAAPLGALGGAATAYVLGPLKSKLSANLGTRTLERVGISGAEEGLQEVAEGVTARAFTNSEIQGNQDLTEGTFGDFVMGAGLGGAIGTAPSIVDVLQTSKNKLNEAADTQTQQTKEDRNKVINAAVETGDVSALMDKGNKETYNPTGAAQALYRIIKSNEDKDKVAKADSQLKDVITELDAEVQILKEDIAAMAPHDDSKRAQGRRKAYERELQRTEKHLENAQRFQAKLSTDTVKASNPEQLIADVATNREGATDELITLMMADPELVNEESINEILANDQVSLDEDQKSFLRSFSQAKQAQHKLKTTANVSNDIYSGGEGYKGITQYKEAFNSAIASGNQNRAQRELEGIGRFAASRREKLDAVKEALQLAQETGETVQVAFDHQRGWLQPEAKMTDKQLEANGGYNIHKNSIGLVEAIEAESAALDATYSHMDNTATRAFSRQAEPTTPTGQPAPAAEETITNKTDIPTQTSSEPTVETSSEPEAVPQARAVGEEKKAEKGKAFSARDLLKANFSQVKGKKSDKSVRPLVESDGFLSQIQANPELLSGYVDSDLTVEQLEHIGLFQEKAQQWTLHFESYIKEIRDDFKYKDPIRFFMEDGQLPENVKTAVAYAAFNYIAENGLESPYNDKETINKMLDRDKDTPISRSERVLYTAGTRQHLITQSLGKAAFQALGLKADPDAPLNTIERMQGSLGSHALRILLQQGLVERVSLPGKLFRTKDTKNKKATHAFIRINREWGTDGKPGALNEQVLEITASSKNTGGILPKLFKAEAGRKEPSFKPIPQAPLKAKRTKQKVSKDQRKILKAEGEKAHYLRLDMVDHFKNLDPEILKSIAGIKPVGQFTHKANQFSTQAKNDALVREITHMQEFLSQLDEKGTNSDQPIYFPRSVWKMFRVGLDTNTINPQTSKIHRHMLSMGGWESTVHKDNSDGSYDNFMLAVGEALGVDTDKQLNEKSLKEVKDKLELPVIKEGVAALKKSLTGQVLEPEDQAAILAAVQEGGENFHSLDGLSSLAQMELSQGDTFKTKIMREVDGITNGPMLTLLQLAVGTKETLQKVLNKGGFYEKGNPHKHYTSWKSETGNEDLYQSLAYDINTNMVKYYQGDENFRKPIRATKFFLGKFVDPGTGNVTKEGRSAVKTPLTGFAFGSSLATAVSNMAGDIIDAYYSKVEKAAEAKDTEALSQTIKALNVFLVDALNPNMSFKEALETELTGKQEKQLISAFSDTTGRIISETMEARFQDLISTRNLLNRSAKTSFELYNLAYQALRKKTLADMERSGEIKRGDEQDLSAKQEADIKEQLKALQPIVHTPMSKMSKQLDAGYYMAKTEGTISQDPKYLSESAFGRNILTHQEGSLSSIKAKGSQYNEIDPGVATVIGLIHSLDSTIASLSYGQHTALNVHDALGLGLNEVFSGAKALNQNTYQQMVSYSVPVELTEALGRSIKGFREFIQANPDLAKELEPEYNKIQAQLKKSFREDPNINGTSDAVIGFFQTMKAHSAGIRKRQLEILKELETVDQYGLEGGSYTVTDKDRKEVDKQLEKLKAVKVPVVEPAEPVPTAWGKLGNAVHASDGELTRVLSSTENITVGKLLPVLASRIRATQNGRILQFNLRLLEQLGKQVKRDTPINWITPDTPATDISEDVSKARAWYSLRDGSINIKSTDFQHSAVTPETLLHEITHAAVTNAIENPTKQTQPLLDELEQLRVKAANFVNSDPSLGKFSNAVADVHELVAWGMTNEGFQRQVLNQVQMESQTTDNPLVSGMKKFIDLITGILFKGSSKTQQERMQTGIAILVQNVSGLFSKVNESNNPDLILKQEDADPVLRYTTEQVYEALANEEGNVDPSFDSHLRSLMDQVVDKVHGPYGAYTLKAKANTTYTMEEIYLKSLTTGKKPFSSKAIAHLRLGAHEAFVLEQVEASMRAITANSHIAYNELRKLYREAKSALKDDPNLSQAEYDFIFKPEITGEGTSDYLSRFAAIGMVYKPLHDRLQSFDTAVTSKRFADMKFGEALKAVLSRGLDLINERLTHTYEGQRADSKLDALVQQLVDLESRKKAQLMHTQNTSMGKLEETVDNLSLKSRDAVEKLGRSKFFKENPIKMIRALGSITSAVAGDRAGYILDAIEDIRNQSYKGRQGFLAALLTEAKGANDSNMVFHELLREANSHEQERKHLIDETAELVRSAFKDNGKDLTKQQWESLTRTFIRTDVAALTDHFSLREIAELVLDPEKLENQIKTFESELSGSNQHYYRTSALDLGYHLATGESVGSNQMLNAHNIAYMANTRKRIQGTDAIADANLPIIDALASLYAVRYLPKDIKAMAVEVLKEETSRGNESGIDQLIKLHKGLQRDAFESIFNNNEVHMIKGYTKEIYDPRISVVAATPEEGAKLEAMGYSRGELLKRDPADSSAQKRLYVSKDNGLRSHVTGTFSYTGKRAKGSKKHSGVTNPFNEGINTYNQQENVKIEREMSARIERMFAPNPGYDPSRRNKQTLVPILNLHGNAVNYRYMMRDETKDRLLNRDNQADTVMGAIAGGTYDKATGEKQNLKSVEALYAQYQEEFDQKPDAYLSVSPESEDPVIRETYNLLPDETKKAIKQIWGKHEMMVRKDLYNLNFGYRKYSLSEAFSKDPEHQNIMEELFTKLLTKLFGEKAALRVTQAEDVWQELVQLTKDILVIKNLFTLLGNISSNVSLLLWMGVNPKKIIETHTTAIRGYLNYQRDRKEVSRLQRLLDIDHIPTGQVPDIEQRIIELQDSIARNPVKELVDAGLFQTLVEDVDNADDRFSYASRLSGFAEAKTKWLPEGVKTVGKTLLMTHDTPLYKLLYQATSMSDFIARYTLHEHLTTRKDDPKSSKEAIQIAVDAFVNYDIPSHQKLQYLNDMGIVWFTKYYIRIQKVLLHLYRDNPGKSLALVSLEHFFPGLDTLVDSGFWNKLGNPFSIGAFKAPDAVDEIIALKVAMSPFN